MFVVFFNLENGEKNTMTPYFRKSMLLVAFDNDLTVC